MAKFLFLILIFNFANSVRAEDHPEVDFSRYQFRKIKVKNGIEVYKASSNHQSGLVPIYAKSVINYPLEKIISVLSDSSRKKEWIPKIISNTVVEQTNPLSRIEYSHYKAPWPLKNRSFLIRIIGKVNRPDKSVTITIRSILDPRYPINEETIRGHTYLGRIILKKITEKRTSFQVHLLTDFKGSIPSWIINLVQSKWPFKMLSRLNQQLSKSSVKTRPEYKKVFTNP